LIGFLRRFWLHLAGLTIVLAFWIFSACSGLAPYNVPNEKAYPVDSGSATYSVLSGRIRAVVGTDIDGQGALAFPIPEGIF
jgi:hypothetical protein